MRPDRFPPSVIVLFLFLLWTWGVPVRSEAGTIVGQVVDQHGMGLSHAVVFVQTLPAGAPPAPTAPVTMDQVNKTFVPHVLPVVVGTEVRFPNRDQIHHHVYSFSPIKTFEIPLYKGAQVPSEVFDRLGAVKLGCNIHDWMSGIILVLPTPYYAQTDPAGRFILPDLPPGRYTVAGWHEHHHQPIEETAQEVEVTEGETELNVALMVTSGRPRVRLRSRRKYR